MEPTLQTNCRFQRDGDDVVCVHCDRRITTDQPPEKVHAKCKKPPWQLGDDLETMLTALGVTKDKWKAAKQKFGLPPNCGCAARQEWLNRVSENLQVKSKQLAETLRTYFSVPR